MKIVLTFVAALLLAASTFGQEASGKVWTDADLRHMKRPLRPSRKVTEEELAGIRARAYVAPPTYPPGPTSYGTTWTPADDRPASTLPAWWTSYPDNHRYAEQPLWPWFGYPYGVPVYSSPRQIVVDRVWRRPRR